MIGRGTLRQICALELSTTPDDIRSTRDESYDLIASPDRMLDARDGIAESPGRALLDRRRDVLGSRRFGIDKRFFPQPEDLG
jgi:hypothetical protein